MSPLKLLERLMSPRKLLAAKLWTNLQGLMGRWVTMPVMSPLKLTQHRLVSHHRSHVPTQTDSNCSTVSCRHSHSGWRGLTGHMIHMMAPLALPRATLSLTTQTAPLSHVTAHTATCFMTHS